MPLFAAVHYFVNLLVNSVGVILDVKFATDSHEYHKLSYHFGLIRYKFVLFRILFATISYGFATKS